MKLTGTLLSISLLISMFSPSPSMGSTLTKPQKACRDFVLNPENSLAISTFLARNGDAYRPVTKEDYQALLFSLCMEEVSAAEKANSLDDLDLYLFSARSHWIGILGYPTETVEDIARDHYRHLHNMPLKIRPKDEVETPYPELRTNAIPDEKIAALEKYSSQKLLRGMTIENHCKSIAKQMPNNETPTDALRKMAIRACEGVMAMNFTKGKHGISGQTVMDTAEKTYGKNSNEYRYFDHVTSLAFSESQ